jgi:hypothetical protein
VESANFWLSLALMVSVTSLVDIGINRNADFLRVLSTAYNRNEMKRLSFRINTLNWQISIGHEE